MSLVTSPGRQLPPDGEPTKPEDRQRQRLILALILFLSAIGVVIYKTSTTVNAPQPTLEAVETPAVAAPAPASANETSPNVGGAQSDTVEPAPHAAPLIGAKSHGKPKDSAKDKTASPTAIPPASVTRTVLPPLAVEVFAGGRPVPLQTKPTAAVHVDTSNGVQGRATSPGADTTAADTITKSGRVRISAEALQVLSHPVDPNYPLLAREMKVQGSVVLDALISRDGTIQALKIVSGPTILATAAMEAVRQWRFKPYLQAGQPVETEARITVNFTISTT